MAYVPTIIVASGIIQLFYKPHLYIHLSSHNPAPTGSLLSL